MVELKVILLARVNIPLSKPCYSFTDLGIAIATCYSITWRITGWLIKHSPLKLQTVKIIATD